MNEEELRTLHRHYAALVAMAKKEQSLTMSHSVEEARGAAHPKETPVVWANDLAFITQRSAFPRIHAATASMIPSRRIVSSVPGP